MVMKDLNINKLKEIDSAFNQACVTIRDNGRVNLIGEELKAEILNYYQNQNKEFCSAFFTKEQIKIFLPYSD